MLRSTLPGHLSNLNRAEAVEDGDAQYKRRVSAAREVCQQVLPGHPQFCIDMNYTESSHVTIDSICLVRYWLMLAMACRLLQRRSVLSLLGRGPGTHLTGTFAGSLLVRQGLSASSPWPSADCLARNKRPVFCRHIQRYWIWRRLCRSRSCSAAQGEDR